MMTPENKNAQDRAASAAVPGSGRHRADDRNGASADGHAGASDPRPSVGGAPSDAPPQSGPKPLLASLFADQMARARIADGGGAYSGAMQDVLLNPAHVDGELAAELDGMMIKAPSIERWGIFHGIDSIGEDTVSVTLDGDVVEIPATERLHVDERSYREAGGADVVPYPVEEIDGRRQDATPDSVLFEARDDDPAAAGDTPRGERPTD